MSVITIERKALEKNDEIAHRNRESLQKLRILVLNYISSPGAGKTSILEKHSRNCAAGLKRRPVRPGAQAADDSLSCGLRTR